MKKVLLNILCVGLAVGLSACCCRTEKPSCPKQCPKRECPKPRCGKQRCEKACNKKRCGARVRNKSVAVMDESMDNSMDNSMDMSRKY